MQITTTPLPTNDLLIQILSQFIQHPWIVGALLMILLVWIYGGKLLDFTKDLIGKKMENETKRLEEIKNINDKHFSLYESQAKLISGVTDALNDLKSFLLTSEGRIIEKISSSEQRISDKISITSHSIIHQNKLDKISSSLELEDPRADKHPD